MKLIIGDKEVNITNRELQNGYISEGREGSVYEYKGDALKIYNEDPYVDRLSEENAKRLKRIPTNRILTPTELIYDENGNYIGYTTPFLIEENKERISLYTIDKLKEESEILKEDIRILSDNEVELDDLNICNLILSNGLYICDSGSFRFRKELDKEKLYKNNIYEINYLIIKLLFHDYLSLTRKEKEELVRIFESTSDFYMDKFLEDEQINPKQKIKPFVKKYVNKQM